MNLFGSGGGVVAVVASTLNARVDVFTVLPENAWWPQTCPLILYNSLAGHPPKEWFISSETAYLHSDIFCPKSHWGIQIYTSQEVGKYHIWTLHGTEHPVCCVRDPEKHLERFALWEPRVCSKKYFSLSSGINYPATNPRTSIYRGVKPGENT